MRASALLVVATCVATLVSVLGSSWVGVRKLDDWRTSYGPLTPELRDDPVARFLGFDLASWEALREELGEGDRYRIVAEGPDRFEVRNYAAYSLLPAIQVMKDADADVVVYYGTAARRAECMRIGAEACIRHRERS